MTPPAPTPRPADTPPPAASAPAEAASRERDPVEAGPADSGSNDSQSIEARAGEAGSGDSTLGKSGAVVSGSVVSESLAAGSGDSADVPPGGVVPGPVGSLPPPRNAPPLPRVRVIRPGRWLQFRDNRRFEITRIDLPTPPGGPGLRGLRIVHLSDLHLTTRWMRGHDELLEHLGTDPPHLVLVSGDFVEDKYDHTVALPTLRRLLARLPARIAVAGILGNHDGDLLARHLVEAGVTLLNGRSLTLSLRGGRVEVVGLPGVGRDDVRSFPLASLQLSPRPAADTLRVVLTHYPDTLPIAASLRPHLVLAGHTHGGQICLPGRLPLITHDSLPPAMAAGLHAAHDTLLLVSRGFGFSAWPLRVFSPAELVEIACT